MAFTLGVKCMGQAWCYCFNVIDVFTRERISYIFDTASTAHTAVQSVLKAVSSIKDISYLRLRTDNGTQYSSREFKKSMQTLGIGREFIWRNTLKQNWHVWSSHGTLKGEYVWPHEFARFQDTEIVLAKTFADHTKDRTHSALESYSQQIRS